jgi:hypothetical protein
MRAIVEAETRCVMAKGLPFGDVDKLTIEPDEILYLVQEMTRRAREGDSVDWHTSIGVLADKYPGDPDRVFCISERIRCLVDMMSDPRMVAWTKKAPDLEYTLTKAPVFKATAKCPLIRGDKRFKFDPDVFFRIILEEAEAEGTT